ncbi:MAG: leucine-rich repeat domain-containing protein [Verrucomicrobia bacterium]|nr:leucine-rich repeat domain-containing protein [Verrucomicrobiota bacterium]
MERIQTGSAAAAAAAILPPPNPQEDLHAVVAPALLRLETSGAAAAPSLEGRVTPPPPCTPYEHFRIRLQNALSCLDIRIEVPYSQEAFADWAASNQATLNQVTILYLYGLALTVVPNEIRFLPNLRHLDLASNNLTELPEWLGDFRQLKNLDVSNNQITTFPTRLGELTSLETLDARRNRITVLPEAISSLTALKHLVLSHNQLETIPAWVSRLTALSELILNGNRLRTLPDLAPTLSHLNVRNNLFVELPLGLASLSSLHVLFADGNPIQTIPTWLSDIESLQRFDCTTTAVTGDIPAKIGALIAKPEANGVTIFTTEDLHLVVGAEPLAI